ncbi:MAG TPA: sigma-70 family RNA polymerase sigma factor [Methanosarcina sp.]|nr:sigma-70 family RNA polymerase sigma factor [Methanosarcina sp.]
MSLSRYYEEICKEPILTEEEEKDLFLELQDKGLTEERRTQIRDRLLKANLRFVFRQAKNFSKNDPLLFEELIAAGNEGLIVGINNFDPSSGFRFLTYAGFWVKQRILNQMSKLRIVSLPIWKQQLAAKIKRFVEVNEEASFEDLVKAFPDAKEKDLLELSQTSYLTYYIEDLGDDPAFEFNPIEEVVEQRMDQAKLHGMIDSLPSLHAEVIRLTFGIGDGVERKHNDIAEELGISKDALRKIKKEAMDMLRSKLGPANPFAD